MRRYLTIGLVIGIVVGIALLPVGYRAAGQGKYRNFRVVEPGVLYRSGQMSPGGFERVLREFEIRSVVSLRETRNDEGKLVDQFEEDFCREHGLSFLRLSPADWTPIDGVIPGDQNITEFLDFLKLPSTQRPVLVHCFAGIHRTGAHCAVYRMEYSGWHAADAIAELRQIGGPRATFADNLLTYLRNYTPRQERSRVAQPERVRAAIPTPQL